MSPMLPDPRELLSRGTGAVEVAAGLLPRAVGLLDSAERLLDRVDALVDRIEGTRQAADEVVERTDEVVGSANKLIVRTAGTLASVEPTAERAQALLSGIAPAVERLQPALEKLADTTSPDEVQALVGLLDHLPHLVKALDEDILPIMESLGSVAPDIHDLLEVTRDLNVMLAKIPGMGLVRRRSEDDE